MCVYWVCKKNAPYKVRKKLSRFSWIMKPHGYNPNVNKQMNIRYWTSEQQYPESVSCFQQLAGWTPLKKFFLVKSQFYNNNKNLNPLGMISFETILQIFVNFFTLPICSRWFFLGLNNILYKRVLYDNVLFCRKT